MTLVGGERKDYKDYWYGLNKLFTKNLSYGPSICIFHRPYNAETTEVEKHDVLFAARYDIGSKSYIVWDCFNPDPEKDKIKN